MKTTSKLLLLLAFMLSMWQAKSQTTGSVCTSAAPIGAQNTFHPFTSASATDQWLSFTAADTGTSHRVFIKLFISGMSSSPNYSLTLYNGSCPTNTILPNANYGITGDTMYYYNEFVPKDTIYQVHIQNNNTPPTTFSMQIEYNVDKTANTCNSYTYTPGTGCELVYNGGFESFKNTALNFTSVNNCYGWYSPTGYATPDSYNTGYNSGPGFGNPPCIFTGYQNPHSGGGFAGIITGSSNVPGYREYIETKLNSPMQAGKIYQISFFMSTADFATGHNSNMDIFIENGSYCDQYSTGALAISPKFSVTTTQDCINWIKVTRNYCAAGGEQYLILGNNTASYTSGACSSNNNVAPCSPIWIDQAAYVYVDDVSVKQLDANISTPYTTCAGSTLTYSITTVCGVDINAGPTYNWAFGDGNTASVTSSVEPHVFTSAGTFSGTVGYSVSSCSVSLPFVTNVSPLFTSLTINNSNPQVCDGASSTLSAVTSPSPGNFSYSWAPGGSTTASIIVSPTGTVIYTLTVTDLDCNYTRTATTTVTGGTTPHPSITASIPACPATTNTLIASGASTYTWSPGGATTASVTATPTVGTVYSVQSATNGCVGTATILVAPVVCCTCGTAITENSSTTTYSAGVYNLNHTFTVTSNYALNGMTIFMGSNAEIVVANNVKLDLITTHLLGCQTMWKGIRYVGSQGTITTSKNVMVEDAITAIDLSPVTVPSGTNTLIIDAQDATFNKNYTGISIGTYTNSGYYPSNFKSAVFTCRKLITNNHNTCLGLSPVTYTWNATNANYALKTTSYTPTNSNISTGSNVKITDDFSVSTYSLSNLEVPYQNSIGMYGIKMDGVGITNTVTLQGFQIGNTGSDYNTMNLFDALGYGIYATNSNVSSRNAAYQYMRQFSYAMPSGLFSILSYDGGVGIYAENNMNYAANLPSSLQVLPVTTGSFSPTGNCFFNNPYGIRTANVQYVDVEYAMIHSNRTATITPSTNPVKKGEYGIYVKSVDYRNIKLKNNVASNLGTAISFYADYLTKVKKPIQYAGAVAISTNTIEANYPGGTTSGTGIIGGIVADNVLNCFNCTISGTTTANIIINNNSLVNVYNGIKSSNWSNQVSSTSANTVTLLSDGTTTHKQVGILHESNYGDLIYNNSVTGFNTTKAPVFAIRADNNFNQEVACNSTSTTYEGVYFTGAANLTTWQNNTMANHIHGMNLFNTTIGQQGNASHGTSNVWSGTWTGANKQTHVQGSDPASNNSKLYFISAGIPTNNDAAPFPLNNYKTTTSQSLFTSTGGSTIFCPATHTVANSAHSLSVFRANLQDMAATSYSYVPYMNANEENGMYDVYRELVADTSLMAGDAALIALYTDGNGGIYNHFNLAENDFFNLDDSLAEIEINAMSPGTTIEANTKAFYSTYLHMRKGTYNSVDDSILSALANGCPTTGGKVVYQARVLYNALNGRSDFYDNQCDTVTIAPKPGPQNNLVKSQPLANFIVYPNPNNGTLYLSADNIGLSAYTIRVFDITGKLITEKQYHEGGVKELNIQAESGIYMVEVTDSEFKTTYRQKVVIQK